MNIPPQASSHSVLKPDLNTPFQIDFEWWKKYDNNWKVHLLSCLCEEHKRIFAGQDSETNIDWIDPETAEIEVVDGLQHILISHCSKQPGFITSQTMLVDAIFRLLISNGNKPTTPNQLAEQTGKSAETILRTFTGVKVYKGIRPCQS